MEITLRPNVEEQIKMLSSKDLEVVRRCIHHYSLSKINSLTYRLHEWSHSYPDWQRSSVILDPRKYRVIECDNNISNTIMANVIMAPWALLDYALQESGRERLKRLIKENRSGISDI